jgi:RNase P subunit RPR2
MAIYCKGCHEPATEEFYVEARSDFYGLFTGHYCDDCYENKYPYRKDAYYDYLNAGERMDDDY